MSSRTDLQELLESILGSRNVYYQPPTSITMQYPAIVYSRDDIENFNANNKPYRLVNGYMVTLIDKNPDSEVVGKLANLPMCSYDRHYVADNLNHDVFTLYF